MEQTQVKTLVTRPAFQAVGLRWEGTFAQAGAGEIRGLQRALQSRLNEIRYVADPAVLLGLSYHVTPARDSFTHYAAVEVERAEDVPSGMTRLSVPSHTYVQTEHRKGQQIERSYTGLFAWIEREGYRTVPGTLTHFELYPMRQDPYDPDPAFTILIPVERVY
ncbi:MULTISPECIES: GyrI-like domain-containing protein [Paenibacillus]|uniref:GyrI-like domain-containing protein n=1 Tax=Paenibacillus TaxID=44249 RepID=UPI001144A6B1|nr:MULTISPECIES: GyrI-like domain-containing protein [unclassified Paenibacillus]